MKKRVLAVLLLGGALLQSAQAEWVYLGKYGADGVVASSFEVELLPQAGATIRARKGINLRDERPQIKNSAWTLGSVVDVMQPGEAFSIDEVVPSRKGVVPGDVWARGSVMR